jgi:3-oxoacyl-[acyl-carrier protein] reductase
MEESRCVSIVTGASRGVGAATAKLLAKEGHNLVINYSKTETGARETAAVCESLGAETIICRADVAQDEDCRRLVEETIRKWGCIDVLVNNAGTTKFCAADNLEGLTKEDFLHIYGVNLVGPYQMIRAVSPHMKRKGKGTVVNVASIAGIMAIGSSVAYIASKAALIAMTKALARALGPEIRINAVCPGFIQGAWLREGMGPDTYDAVKTYLEGSLPLRITATPEKIAEAIFYFIHGADLVTGETLILDGGMHLGKLM